MSLFRKLSDIEVKGFDFDQLSLCGTYDLDISTPDNFENVEVLTI